ncbi:putative prolyl 4-hydroxylase 6 isoform X1 [Carex littledalei]|uniref:Putative prolyl 4-hydroxylase 6 isoform X1 n=1 Tax=Carex littledalei TaxID=544730 RepID=A0A833RGA7_9POAL|nr:putative prolyl 4-hydroxylase 6 isoform X1 [Carex littledalei]
MNFIQVWHYGVNDSYGPHYDFYENNEDKPGGNRVATVLIYLSNVTHGGETIFPKSQTTKLKDESFSECASAGYAIKPVKGSAVFFFNLNLDSTLDNSSLHQSCKNIVHQNALTVQYTVSAMTIMRIC